MNRNQGRDGIESGQEGGREPSYVLDREAVRAVDRAATEEYGLPGIVLMENAARALSREAQFMLDAAPTPSRVALIICGAGNNGGDGWALARHLHNARSKPIVAILGEPKPGTDAEVNRSICRRMGIEETFVDEVAALHAITDVADVAIIVDAIFGTGLDRDVTGRAAEVIEWINASGLPVLAVDVPSGLDCDTGRPLGVAVRATRTVSFVGAKPAFDHLEAQSLIGEVVIGDIGAPLELTERFGRVVPRDPPTPYRRGRTDGP